MIQQFFINEQRTRVLVIGNENDIEIFNTLDSEEIIKEDITSHQTSTMTVVTAKKSAKIHIHEGDAVVQVKSTNQMQKVADRFNAGDNTPDIASELGLSIGSIYQLKAKAKKLGLLKEKAELIENPRKSKLQEHFKRNELVKAYGNGIVLRVEQMFGDGYKVEEIAKDIDVELPVVQVQTIIDRLEL